MAAACTTPEGVAVSARAPTPELELRFPEGYDATRARVRVDAAHWQFAANSGAHRAPNHYQFAIQPRGTGPDASAPGAFMPPPEAVEITVQGIRTPAGTDTAVQIALQVENGMPTITRCK